MWSSSKDGQRSDPLQRLLEVATANVVALKVVQISSIHHIRCLFNLLCSDQKSCQKIFICFYRTPVNQTLHTTSRWSRIQWWWRPSDWTTSDYLRRNRRSSCFRTTFQWGVTPSWWSEMFWRRFNGTASNNTPKTCRKIKYMGPVSFGGRMYGPIPTQTLILNLSWNTSTCLALGLFVFLDMSLSKIENTSPSEFSFTWEQNTQ